jgi:hypothetical protein
MMGRQRPMRLACPWVVMLAVGMALALPGVANGGQSVVSGEFVGAIPNADPKDPPGGPADELVAVAVYDPSPRSTRPIRVYICDSEAHSPDGDAEWFTGTIRGNSFRLRSADGDATVRGRLTETAATGTARMPDGRSLRFRAVPARAGAGLYDMVRLIDGSYFGRSVSGAVFTGTVVEESVEGELFDRIIRGSTTTLTRYTTRPFGIRTRFISRTDPPGALPSTAIMLPNARKVTGRSNQIRSAGGTTTEFYCWIQD